MQVPGARTCVRWRAVRLPGEEGPVNAQRGQKVLQTDHLSSGLLSQPLHMVGLIFHSHLEDVIFSLCHVVIEHNVVISLSHKKSPHLLLIINPGKYGTS